MILEPSNKNYSVTQTVTQKSEEQEQMKQDQMDLVMSTLEQSSLLYHSCIDQEASQLNETSLSTKKQGSVLIDQLQNLVDAAKTLNALLEIVAQENTTLLSTGVTLSAAIAYLWNGNLVTGLGLAGVAANEIKKIISRHLTAPTETKDLVSEVKTGLHMIQQLEENQMNSLATINNQISIVLDQLKDVESQMIEIENLATQGSLEGEKKKKEAQELCQKSRYAYLQALHLLEQSQLSITQSLNNFELMIIHFNDLIEQAKSGQLNIHDIAQFVSQAELIVVEMQKTQDTLESAQHNFNQGLEELHTASKLNKEALTKYLQAFHVMDHFLNEIRMNAESQKRLKEMQSQLKETSDEAKDAKERAENVQKIAEYESAKIEELQKRLENEWGNTSVLTGTAIGTGSIVLGGGALSVPLGFGVAALTHYSRKIYHHARTIFNQQIAQQSLTSLEDYKVTFNPISTGWGNYLVGLVSQILGGEGRPSKTAGIITINLGNGIVQSYHFNLNSNGQYGNMIESEMKKLNDELTERLKDKNSPLSPQKCLDIIDSLNEVNTEQGSAICLVTKDSPFFAELRRTCKKMLKQEIQSE